MPDGASRGRQSVGVDIGGTFTDLVAIRDGGIVVSKSSTIVDDPTKGVADCVEIAGISTAEINEFLHGSTIAINTVLERKGATTALLTTEGFRDVYAIGRSNRPEGFNLNFARPKPLIRRELTFEASERLNANGEVLEALDEDAVRVVGEKLSALGVDAIAVCFLHSYANPAHENRAGDILKETCPDIYVTLSNDILREYREYERTSTTALNAYVGPRVSCYLDRLDTYLNEGQFGGTIQIMRSNGGTMSLNQAHRQPVTMMESGPVAGMIGAGHLANQLGFDQCIGFDMGGTTAKASMFRNGEPAVHEEYFIGGYASGQPMQMPVVDIIEIGAGGGSIAWCDTHGGLHVGPESAGAQPGPACYGQGGDNPVITDADLILGRLNAGRFLSGKMALDPALSEKAIREKVAGPLGLSVIDAALGIAKIADSAMSLAVRAVSVERGSDPRDCAMIAFGGAGPLHALSIARDISIPTVIIPRFPGNFSALGMLMAPWRQDLVQTFVVDLSHADPAAAQAAMNSLADQGKALLDADGLDANDAAFAFAADLRYVGQEHAIPVPMTDAQDLADGGSPTLREAFDRLHQYRYGHAAPEERIQVAKIRLTVTVVRGDNSALNWLSASYTPEDEQADSERPVYFEDAEAPLTARIVWRPGLTPGTEIIGPAVVEEPNSTTLLYPGDVGRIDEHGHLIVTVGGG